MGFKCGMLCLPRICNLGFIHNIKLILVYHILLTFPFSDILADTEFIERLRSRQYDGAFAEVFDSCSLPLFRLVGIKNVMLTSPTAISEMTVDALGLPTLPSFVPGK